MLQCCVYTLLLQHKAWLAHTTNSYQLYLETAANDLSSANSNFRASLKCVAICTVFCNLYPLYVTSCGIYQLIVIICMKFVIHT